MYQFIHNKLPNRYSNYYTYSTDSHLYFTRNFSKNNLHLPRFSTARNQKLYKHVAAKLRNNILHDIKQAYKNFLLETYKQT